MMGNKQMADRARFTLQITLRDNHGFEQPLAMAIDVDHALRISSRAVDEMKLGVVDMAAAVTLMKSKEFRRRVFRGAALQLAEQLADRMEDAEGWHDPERIQPAREQLGGTWR
jgi:hypothetical protein